jgi:hypothetical protein
VQVPLKVVFRSISKNDELDGLIRNKVTKLKTFSVLNDDFDLLDVVTGVRFIEENGEKVLKIA